MMGGECGRCLTKGLVCLQQIEAREAVRILDRLVGGVHVKTEAAKFVTVEITVPLDIFDRLCLWGVHRTEIEDDDPAEAEEDCETMAV